MNMNKVSYPVTLSYIYDGNRKGAKYSTDGGKTFMNAGEFLEILTKHCKGYNAQKDANTAYDKGSDLAELNASIKSSKATLTTKNLGGSFDEILRNYFQSVPSTLWIWAVLVDETLITYEMNRTEFEQFTRQWAGYSENRSVVRYKITSNIMIQWLEERCGE
jgi:hypothetical protein